MFPSALDAAAREVLGFYPAHVRSAAWTPLGNAGGFSGARLWRGESPAGRFCLRAWPEGHMTAAQLRPIHDLMNAARSSAVSLSFVPRLQTTSFGTTWVEEAGRLWEVTDWMPGRADFHDRPTDDRLRAAVRALAKLHEAWAARSTPPAPCPAVQRRMRALADWRALLASGWRPDFRGEPEADPVRPWAGRAWAVLPAQADRAANELRPWKDCRVPLQPCLCDVWHDHVLFDGDEVTGIIDYGAAKPDCVAVDLARLLGSFIPDEAERVTLALSEYAAERSLPPEAEELVTLLDWTGTVVGALNWLRWLYEERRPYADRAAVARRLAGLVGRLERGFGERG